MFIWSVYILECIYFVCKHILPCWPSECIRAKKVWLGRGRSRAEWRGREEMHRRKEGGGGRRLRGSRGGAKNKKGVSSRSKVKTTIWHLFSRYFKHVLRGVIGGAKLLHRTIIFNGRFTQLTYGCPKTYEHGYSTFAPLGMMRRRVWGVYGGWAGCQTCTVSRWSPECFW